MVEHSKLKIFFKRYLYIVAVLIPLLALGVSIRESSISTENNSIAERQIKILKSQTKPLFDFVVTDEGDNKEEITVMIFNRGYSTRVIGAWGLNKLEIADYQPFFEETEDPNLAKIDSKTREDMRYVDFLIEETRLRFLKSDQGDIVAKVIFPNEPLFMHASKDKFNAFYTALMPILFQSRFIENYTMKRIFYLAVEYEDVSGDRKVDIYELGESTRFIFPVVDGTDTDLLHINGTAYSYIDYIEENQRLLTETDKDSLGAGSIKTNWNHFIRESFIEYAYGNIEDYNENNKYVISQMKSALKKNGMAGVVE